jgi:hypothetical protein
MSELTKAEINRANAQHSTGPKTEEGKQRSKYNARKHNLTGQAILSSEEDLKNYFDCSARLIAALHCQGEHELRLAQSLADAQWQLDRARTIETNLFFQLSVPHMPEDSNDAADWAGSQAKAFMDNAKQLDLISRYATRYHRQVLQLHTLLAQVQRERRKFDENRHHHRQQRQRESFQEGVNTALTSGKHIASAPSGFVSQNAIPGLNPERQRGDSAAQNLPHHKKTLHQIAVESIENRKNQAA